MAEIPNFNYEKKLWSAGIEYVAGVDEAGRGPLAGPVVAAAVIFRENTKIDGLKDSKKLSSKKREELFQTIQEKALAMGIGVVDNEVIDKVNILRATHLAMRRAIGSLKPQPGHLLIDGYALPDKIYPQTPIIKGDNLSISISAASIIAKVTRDRMMLEYDAVFPGYFFRKHKGYGTELHRKSIARLGPCPIHRKSFSGVKEHLPVYRTIKNKRTLGRIGEDQAAYYLHKKDYKILARNFHAGAYGEIDIIAENSDNLIFIEVKSSFQVDYFEPEYRIDQFKQEQLGDLAGAFLSQYPTEKSCRFDVITVNFGGEVPVIRHIKDAFRL